jgi:hypothetical protein
MTMRAYAARMKPGDVLDVMYARPFDEAYTNDRRRAQRPIDTKKKYEAT